MHIWISDLNATFYIVSPLEFHSGIETAVCCLSEQLPGECNFAAILSILWHAGTVGCIFEEGGPELQHIFLLNNAVLREVEVNWLLKVLVLPSSTPNQSKAG